jgi:cob(I)alamin adenosyltransferase
MPIYTRAGDTGTTSLFGGKKVLKCNELVDVYGSIDELNSWVGFCISTMTDKRSILFLQAVQRDLFTIGSTLAGWKGDVSSLSFRVREMEHWIDTMEMKLPDLSNFILPGGNNKASIIHVARSLTRRVERQVVALLHKKNTDVIIITYLNRLSDLFFVLARYINKKSHEPELIWNGKKKVNRKT